MMPRLLQFDRSRGAAWLGRAGGCLLVAGLLGACGPREQDVRDGVPASAVAVLQSASDTEAAWADVLKELFPSAPVFTADQQADALSHCVRRNGILVVCDAYHLPQDDWGSLVDYLTNGGAAVFLGRQPFQARAVRSGDGLITLAQREEAVAREAFGVSGFTSIQSWPHRSSSGRVRGSVRVASIPGVVWPAVEVDAEGFREWNAMVLEKMPPALGDSGASRFVFYARGGERTSRLALVCRESDGSHWSYVISVGPEWRRFVVHERQFAHAYGGAGRGAEGDRLRLARMASMTIGLSMHLAPQAPGSHRFGLSDVFLARDEAEGPAGDAWPDLPMIAPDTARYAFDCASVQVEAASRAWPTGAAVMESPFPRARGVGAVNEGVLRRWVPLARAYDSRGELLGWPAGLHLEMVPGDLLRRWGWVGAVPDTDSRAACSEMLMACLRRLYAGTFLLAAGADRFSFEMDQPMDLRAAWLEGERMRVPLRVAVELMGGDGRVLRRVVSSTGQASAGALQGPVGMHLGRAPGLRDRAEFYTFRILLEDATGSGDVYDEMEQRVVVRAVGDVKQEWTTVEDAHLMRQQTPLFLMGVNYRPISVNGAGGDSATGWLEPDAFDPDMVERDLKQLGRLKVNALAMDYTSASQAPQLNYVVEAARELDLVILLHLPGLSPLAMDLEGARQLIDAAGLLRESQVFALELAREPRFGRRAERAILDPLWRAWLQEQYGSMQHAEEHLGMPLWRANGEVTGPPDNLLARDGDHRAAVAVYRRFLDDIASRRLGEGVRFLRELGCRQLLTVRYGARGFGSPWAQAEAPMDVVSGAQHLDFLSLSGWNLQGDEAEFAGASFLTAYARGVSGGKPVVWLQYGTDVGPGAGPIELANQERVYRNIFDLQASSSAAGCFAWWYPGGWNVESASDMGLVGASGALRPAGEALRNRANALRSVKPGALRWDGREILREQDARGLPALWKFWDAAYRKEAREGGVQEVRPLGFGKPTTEMPWRAVGGGAPTGREPWVALNAEWGAVRAGESNVVRRAGAPVTLELGRRAQIQLLNTGATTWVASREGQERTVWVVAQHPSRRADRIRVATTASGRSVALDWQPNLEGEWSLRPWLSRVGPFGEELVVQVVASEGAAGAATRNP